jgi:two-component system, NarL family, sensor histidine kinase LiaS
MLGAIQRVPVRLARSFHRLQWRFALSYMLVTVLAVASIPILYFTASYLFAIRSPDLPRQTAAALQPEATQVLPYLDQQPPDQAGLRRWLVDFNSNGRLQAVGNFADLWMSGPPYGTSTMAVVDVSGRVIATTTANGPQPGGAFTPALSPRAQQVVQAALAGDTRSNDLATPIVNGRAEVAVPIQVPGHVVGALVLDMDVTATQNGFLPRALEGLLGFILIVSIGAGLIGLIFGYVISRGMTHRIKRIATAADAWSHGDFSEAVRDPSGDELGQLARDLNRMAEQVQGLLEDRRQLAVVGERNRLSRELHDAVKQQVFATGMQIAAAEALAERDPVAAKARMTEAGRLIGEAQQELNALIRELRPVALGDKGLVPALRELAAEWSRATGIAAVVRAQGEQPAPLQIEQAFFRVAQEALANVAKHSGATSVDLRVSWEHATLDMTIQDDGHGFDLDERSGAGVGLGSMSERVEALGGELLVSSGANGTRIEAQVRLGEKADLPVDVVAAEKGAER